MDPKTGKKILQILGVVGAVFFVGALGYAVYVKFFWGKVSDENRLKAQEYYLTAIDNISDLSYSTALENLNEALNLDPYNIDTYLAISNVYKSKNRYDLQLQFLSSTEGVVRSDERIQREIGISQYKNGRYDECSATLQSLFKANSVQESDVYLFNALLKVGEYNLATGYLSDINSCDNNYKQALVLIKTLLAGSDYNTAINSISVCKDTSALGPLYTTLSEIKNSELDDAGKTQKTLVVIANEALKNGFDRYVVYLLETKMSEFQNYWEPNFLLASAYFKLGDVSKALACAQTACTVNPFRYEPVWLIAQIKSQQGDKEDAILKYEQAILLAGDEASPVQEEYVDFLIAGNLFSKLDIEFILVAEKYERNEEWTEYGEICLKALNYYLGKDNEPKATYYVNKLLTYSQEELSDLGLNDMFYLLYVEYLVSKGDISTAEGIVADITFEEQIFTEYVVGVINFTKREDSVAIEHFRKAIDMDTQGFITDKSKEYLRILGVSVK
ncbi:hypothetical protein JW962_03860 [Candidatus Dojkabacteria bacterium]|nr:hypothetical protein [Candidatus Dojkabacteria bacterium]